MDFGRQRDFSEFYEQLNELRMKFRNWDSCEKTVALYYLMVGLPFANARFLQNALDQLVTTINTPDTQVMELNANDPEVIRSFLSENPQSALCSLLNHLPLLRPGNKEAAKCYLNTIQRILTEFITPPFKKIYNECVEIMSYVYIHPAFDKEDKTMFKHLLKQVLNRVTPENFVHSPVNEPSLNKKRSNSLTPGTPYINDTESWSSQENLIQSYQKPRSFSLSCDKTLTDASNIQTSSSDSKLEEIIRNNFPLMKSIMSWLKSLRLHKYSWIFHDLTANQMMNMSEDYLMGMGVTKGARQKLLLSLQKLRNRQKLLLDLEMGLMNGSNVYDALKELKGVLQSPMQITMGEDLCSLFVKVMGKVCTQLLMSRHPTDETLVLFNSLCEKANGLDCFTVDHKKKLAMWKEQLDAQNLIVPCPQRMSSRKSSRSKNPPPNLFEVPAELIPSAQKSSSYPNMQINTNLPMHRHSVDSVTLQNQLLQINNTELHQNVNNKYSYKLASKAESLKNNCDIENSLESLCIQMMEHALGP
ncbi:protein Smaug homolog 1 [Anthonomus grandis grandis]|uniref:protein Smaug homolog 1 n=1 Tax=Anthonomus grandis grandis TaxID=2921223 RepID=UPI002165C7B7|nr:protein Smaug homolog 1 [Anthonomus grandis grandis]